MNKSEAFTHSMFTCMKMKIQLYKTYADLMVTAQNVVTKSGHLNDIDY